MPIFIGNRSVGDWQREVCDALNDKFEDLGGMVYAKIAQKDSGSTVDIVFRVVDECIMFSVIGGDFGLPWIHVYELTYTDDGFSAYLAPALQIVHKTVFE